MKKILFGITSLTLGGAERVLVDMVNELAKEYEIKLFTIYPKGELERELEHNIERKSMCKKARKEMTKVERLWVSFRLLFCKKAIYKRFIKGADTEVAFLEGPITRLFEVKNKQTKKVVWVHNDISKVFGKGIKATVKKYVDGKSYKSYDKIVLVSKENQENFKTTYPNIDSSKLQVIYNYLNQEKIIKKAEEPIAIDWKQEEFKILTVARLVEQKAIERFIKVHSKLMQNGIQAKVYVIGEGPERKKLESLMKKEQVEHSFILLGKKQNPYPYIKQCDLFVLLSYFEGYGMVLEEAKILNKSIMITNTAAREAVVGYARAEVVENEEGAIYEGLARRIKEQGKQEEGQKVNYSNQAILEEIRKLM